MSAPVAGFVQLPSDSGNTGKKMRTQTRVVGADTVHEHFFVPVSAHDRVGSFFVGMPQQSVAASARFRIGTRASARVKPRELISRHAKAEGQSAIPLGTQVAAAVYPLGTRVAYSQSLILLGSRGELLRKDRDPVMVVAATRVTMTTQGALEVTPEEDEVDLQALMFAYRHFFAA